MRRKIKNRNIVEPDIIYNSQKLGKFINNIMLNGKKETARKSVYKAFEIIKEKTKTGNFAMHLGLEDDVELYHNVCVKIKPWLIFNNNWKDISWLS